MGSWLGDRKWRYRNRSFRWGGAGGDPGTFRCGAVGAIVVGRAVPGGRTRRGSLLPIAGVPLLICRGGVMLRAVRALHCRRSYAGYAKDAENQHQHPSALPYGPW